MQTIRIVFTIFAASIISGCTDVAPDVSCLFGCNEAITHEYSQNDGSLNFKGQFLPDSEVHFYEDGNEILVQPTFSSNYLKIVPIAAAPQQLKTSSIYKLIVSTAKASGTSTFTLPAGTDSTVLDFARVAPPVCGVTEKLNFNSVSNTFACETLNVSWNQLTNVPTTFAPSAHNHAISDITNLDTTLNSKANAQDVVDLLAREQQRGERFRYSFPSGVKAYYTDGFQSSGFWHIVYSNKNFVVNIGGSWNSYSSSWGSIPIADGGMLSWIGGQCYFTSNDCTGNCYIYSGHPLNPMTHGYIMDFVLLTSGKILEFNKTTPWSNSTLTMNSYLANDSTCYQTSWPMNAYFIPNSISINLPDISGIPTLEPF